MFSSSIFGLCIFLNIVKQYHKGYRKSMENSKWFLIHWLRQSLMRLSWITRPARISTQSSTLERLRSTSLSTSIAGASHIQERSFMSLLPTSLHAFAFREFQQTWRALLDTQLKAVFHLNKPCFWIKHFGKFLVSPAGSDSKMITVFSTRSNLVQKHSELLDTLKWQEDAPVEHVCPSLCMWNEPQCNEGRARSLHPAVGKHLCWWHTCGSSTQKDNGETACSNNQSKLCGLWPTWHNHPPMPVLAWEMEQTYKRPKANHLGAHCRHKQDDSWSYSQIHPANTGSIKPMGTKLQIVEDDRHAKAHWKACTIRRGSTMGL